MRLALVVLVCTLAGCAAPGSVRVDGEPPAAENTGEASEQAQEVILHALAQIGVPYRYGGDTPGAGFDCSGLVQYVYGRATGLSLPRNTFEISKVGRQIERSALRPGDLVFFNTLRRPYSHVGIYLGGQRFVHAPSQGGKVEIVHMNLRYWSTRFDGARRLVSR